MINALHTRRSNDSLPLAVFLSLLRSMHNTAASSQRASLKLALGQSLWPMEIVISAVRCMLSHGTVIAGGQA